MNLIRDPRDLWDVDIAPNTLANSPEIQDITEWETILVPDHQLFNIALETRPDQLRQIISLIEQGKVLGAWIQCGVYIGIIKFPNRKSKVSSEKIIQITRYEKIDHWPRIRHLMCGPIIGPTNTVPADGVNCDNYYKLAHYESDELAILRTTKSDGRVLGKGFYGESVLVAQFNTREQPNGYVSLLAILARL